MQILTRLNKVIAYSEQGYTLVGASAVCKHAEGCYSDVHITDVECVPMDIDQYEYYYIDGKFVKGDVSVKVALADVNKTLEEVCTGVQCDMEVVEYRNATWNHIGTLHRIIRNGVVHIYGDLIIVPHAPLGTEERVFQLNLPEGMSFASPPGVLYIAQLTTMRTSEGVPVYGEVTVQCQGLTLTILKLPAEVAQHELHINIMYAMAD